VATKAGAQHLKNHRVHTKTPTLVSNYTPVGKVVFTFAHHSGKYFRCLDFSDVTMESDVARRESRRKSYHFDSITATAASGYKARRRVLRKNGIDASST
jgi:hypothetical protein